MRRPPFRILVLLLVALAPVGSGAAQSRSDEFVDSIVASATRAIEQRRPWQATRLLNNLTRDPTTRPQSVLTAAARAAAQWEGWESIVRLLYRESWLDSQADGLGHALLGRALVERSQPEVALPHTRRAVALASDTNRGERLVVHARGLDRADQLDSAAAAYAAAAELLPLVRDWLLLRAAGVTVDSAARRALLAKVTDPVAAARVPWTEALARDRAGDWRGAAREYARIGAELASIRLRFKGAAADRAAARADLTAFLSPEHPAEELEDAIVLFDREVPEPTPQEELRIARRAVVLNQADRAARGFTAAGATRLTDRDRFSYATVLTRLGRPEQAIPLFDQVHNPDLKAAAAYQRARLLLRTRQYARAVPALIAIPEAFPDDSVPAGSALFLHGDLYVDRLSDDSARTFFLASASRYPTTPFGQRADFQAALIAYLDRDYAQAQAEFDRIAAEPRHAEAVAAHYWSGRSREARGDTAEARRRYQGVVARAPDSYYAARASRRLGAPFWSFTAAPSISPDSLPASLRKARQLIALGMRVEARFELDAHADVSGLPADQIVARAQALAAAQWPGRALRLAQRAQAKGVPFDRTLAELLFPLPFREVMLADTRAGGASLPAVAGLIRQESAFDPEARSTADARGLMQVLPSVGAELMRKIGSDWDPVLLYQPDLNIDFGIAHFNEALEKVGWLERALAAYNAGLDRVARWRTIRGMDDDPEVFVERIPFVETRDYVRRVMANQAMYAALYGDLVP